jgi:hypothetical protein
MDHYLGGIPLYDSGSNVLYNSRISGLADEYIPNFGFGVGFGSLTKDLEGEETTAYKRYFHAALTDDPSTFNAMNSKDSVSGDMYDMVALSYYDVRFNSTRTGYDWKPILAKDNRPIALNMNTTTHTATKWRVHLHANEDGYVYSTLSSTYAKYNGQKIQLEDYLTPFKATLVNKWARSTELCSSTTGFAGCQAFANDPTQDFATVVTGIKVNTEEGSLDFEFTSPKTEFSAMTNISSTLYSPLPQAFIDEVTPDKFGVFSDVGVGGSGLTAVDSVLSVGTYVPEVINAGQNIIFKKNDKSCVASDYHYAGYHYGVYSDAKSSTTALYEKYMANKLDVCSVPSSKQSEAKGRSDLRRTKGDTVWKFQVNSCDQTEWNYLFGPEGTIAQNDEGAWTLKPIMSNVNFLNGLYYSVNRTELADFLGRNAAQGFFSGAYMSDPEQSIAYRDTDAGKAVLEDRFPDTCGFNKSAAQTSFKAAIDQERAKGNYTTGTAANPDIITLDVEYQDSAAITDEGQLMKEYWETTFNAIDPTIQLKLDIKAPAVWSDVYYNFCMTGCFDLAFGSISGNTLDPLSFLNTLCSNNVSGFTLSWGTDTNAVSKDIVYDNKYWSFDALQAAGDTGAVVVDGVNKDAFWADGETDFGVDALVDASGNVLPEAFEISANYAVFDGVSVTIDFAKAYNPGTRAEIDISDLKTVDNKDGTFTITGTVPADGLFYSAKKGYAYCYLEIFYSKIVLDIPASGLEFDMLLFFALAA